MSGKVPDDEGWRRPDRDVELSEKGLDILDTTPPPMVDELLVPKADEGPGQSAPPDVDD